MATRSLIGLQCDDHIKYVYCHWDGYPSHNGQILSDHYRDRAKVEKLISLGDLSVLQPEIGESNDFDIDNRIEGVCLFYGRDRGEQDTDYRTCNDSNQFIEVGNNLYTDYVYLFQNGNWLVSTTYDDAQYESAEIAANRENELC